MGTKGALGDNVQQDQKVDSSGGSRRPKDLPKDAIKRRKKTKLSGVFDHIDKSFIIPDDLRMC